MVRALRCSCAGHLVVDVVGDDLDRRERDDHHLHQEGLLRRERRNDPAFHRRRLHLDVGRQSRHLRRRRQDASQQSHPNEAQTGHQYPCAAEIHRFVVHQDHLFQADLRGLQRVHVEVELCHQDQAVVESDDRSLSEAVHRVAAGLDGPSVTSGGAVARRVPAQLA
jgi:hypothetical protein